MADLQDLPERRIKNYWAALIVAGGIIVGSILIARYSALLGFIVMVAAFVVAVVFFRLNNRHHIKQKADDKEPAEFDK